MVESEMAVGDGVGIKDGDCVGTKVGDIVGSNDGDPVGSKVGDADGWKLGNIDGSKVGDSVGSNVGGNVGDDVGASYPRFCESTICTNYNYVYMASVPDGYSDVDGDGDCDWNSHEAPMAVQTSLVTLDKHKDIASQENESWNVAESASCSMSLQWHSLNEI